MNLEIDNNNNLKIDYSDCIQLIKNNNELIIYGEFLSIFSNKKFLSKQDSLDYLKDSIDNIQDLKIKINNIIGSCHLILIDFDKNIYFFNSLESPGVFYGTKDNKLFICLQEIDLAKRLYNNDLNDFEIADFVFRNFNTRSSFKSIINGVNRLPSGFNLIVKKNLNYKLDYHLLVNDYCTDKRGFKELDLDFKFYLESVIKFYRGKYKEFKLFSNLSAGIDSTVVTIACKKIGHNTAFHLTKDQWIADNAKILSDKIDVPINYIFGEYNKSPEEWWSKYKLNSDIDMKKNIGIYPIDNIHYLDFFKTEKFIMFGGSAFGQNYQIFPSVFPIFGMHKLTRIIMNIKQGYIFRFLSTKSYISLLKFSFIPKILEKVFSIKGKLASNQKEYLSYLAINSVKPYLPEFDEKVENLPDSFFQKYIDYLSEVNLKNFLKEEDYKRIKNNLKLSNKKIQKYARLISLSRGVFNNKFHNNKTTNHKSIVVDPPFVAPLCNFMLKLNIGFREVFFPKGLHFRYFKNELGWSYFNDFIPRTYYYKSVLLRILTTPYRFFRRSFLKKDLFDNSYDKNLIKSDNFQKLYLKYFNVDESILLKKIKNKELKEVVRNMYKKVLNGEKIKLYQVFQIINLEIFLREVYLNNEHIHKN